MVFFKPIANQQGTIEFKFQIMGENYQETYSVYDNNTKKYYRGQQFIPILNGGIVAESTKTIPRAQLEAQFPNLSKKYQFVWEILIQNTKYQFGFAKTAHDKLLECIQMARNFKIEPYEVEFIYRKTGSGLNTTHEVMSGERVGIPQNVREAEARKDSHIQGMPTPPSFQQPSWMNQPIQGGAFPPFNQVVAQVAQQKAFVSPLQPPNQAFVPQNVQTPTQPTNVPVSPFSKAWQGAGRQDHIQLDADEQAILQDAEKSTDKLQEVEFINGFAGALQQRGRTPDVVRIVQIYRQLYTGAK